MTDLNVNVAASVRDTISRKRAASSSLKRGAAWTAIDTLLSAGLAFLFRLLMARFVAPSEFGVFALALTTFAIVQVINEFGMAATVIQRSADRFTDEVVDTAFAASTYVSTGLFLINLLVIAPVSAWVYASERVGFVTAVIGVSFLLTPTVSISRALLFRRLDYRAVTLARIVSTLVSIVLAGIVLAITRNVWALVTQVVSAQLFLAIGMYWIGDWRPRLRFTSGAFREMVGYSGLVFASDSFAAVSKNLDIIVLGRLVSQGEVGLYSLAFYITDVVRLNLASVLNRVMFTHYSMVQNDLLAVRFYVIRTLSWNALIIFPVMIIAILAGPVLLPAILGKTWIGMDVTLQLLAVSVMLATIGGTTPTVFKAIGKPGVELTISVLSGTVVLAPALFFGVKVAGIAGAAAAVCFKSLINVMVRQPILDRLVGSTLWGTTAATLGALLAQIPLVIVWLLVETAMTWRPVAMAITGVAAQLVVYGATLLVIRRIGGALWPAFDGTPPATSARD